MIEKKINDILGRGTHESIVLAEIITNGKTTVRDLLPKMNCPYSAIKGLKDMGIPIDDREIKIKKTVLRNGKTHGFTERYKEYFLRKTEPEQMRLAV